MASCFINAASSIPVHSRRRTAASSVRWRGGAAAQLECAQRFALARQQFVSVLFEQGGRVLGHNIGEAHHTTLFQPTLIWPIRLLMYSSADS